MDDDAQNKSLSVNTVEYICTDCHSRNETNGFGEGGSYTKRLHLLELIIRLTPAELGTPPTYILVVAGLNCRTVFDPVDSPSATSSSSLSVFTVSLATLPVLYNKYYQVLTVLSG